MEENYEPINSGQTLEAGKGKETKYLLEPPERNAALPPLGFSLMTPVLDF